MSLAKRLISDTAIYGISNILARGLNVLLFFFIAKVVAGKELGIFADLYATVAFLQVVLTHGMETSFFRHVNIYDKDKNIFATAYTSVFVFALVFLLTCIIFLQPIAQAMAYPEHTIYILIFAFIVFFDVINAVPFAQLRNLNKAKVFAGIKVFNVIINIIINLAFLWLAPKLATQDTNIGNWISNWYDNDNKVLYVFIANLVASGVNFLLLSPLLLKAQFKIDKAVYQRMLKYALPLMLLGFAGTINEMFDRKILRFYLPYSDEENLVRLGVYAFAYKITIVMTMFFQAYKFAVEPLLFSEVKNKNAPSSYARIMQYYVAAICAIFILVLFNLPLMQYILFDLMDYNEPLKGAFVIVPILLAANAVLGIYFNVSTWYKVTDKTMYGAYIAFFGAGITIVLNLIFVPIMGIAASAWATLICYLAMTTVGLYFGNKFYPIPYNYKRLGFYIGLAGVACALYYLTLSLPFFAQSVISILFTCAFGGIVYKLERNSAVGGNSVA